MTVMDFPSSPVNGQTTSDGRYYFDASVGSSGAWRSAPLPVGGLPAGSIIQWGATTPPANWLLCDGSAVSRTTYSSLFAAIGTTYGVGDGSTTFNLPDLPNGTGSGIVGFAEIGTSQLITTTVADIPGLSTSVNMRAGRTYQIIFNSSNVASNNGSNRARIRFIVDSTVADVQYSTATIGGLIFNGSAYYTPPSDGTRTVKIEGWIDTGGGNMTLYKDSTSDTTMTVVDLGEAAGSGLRQRHIIKATAGWTAGDSELATRLGVVESRVPTTGVGLVRMIPSTVQFSGGTATSNTAGMINHSGVTSLSLNNVFGTYRNYRIIISGISSASTGLLFRFRSNGADFTGTVHSRQVIIGAGTGSAVQSRASGENNWEIGTISGQHFMVVDMYNPNTNWNKNFHSLCVRDGGANINTIWESGYAATTTAYNSFTIFPASGTITGEIVVYGYNE